MGTVYPRTRNRMENQRIDATSVTYWEEGRWGGKESIH